MWIFAVEGFFSVVHSRRCGEDELAVRAQSRADLERLLARLGVRAAVSDQGESEYAWRAFVPRAALAAWLSQTVLDLDYDNFKTASAAADPCRVPALNDVREVVMDRWGAWE